MGRGREEVGEKRDGEREGGRRVGEKRDGEREREEGG